MNTPLDLLTTTLTDPLAAARSSSQAIGYVGFDIPPEFGLITEREFCHLPWQKGRSTPRVDQWLESAFPDWARSIVQDWADGVFDCFGQVVFSRADDTVQRLYYYLCELQRRKLIGGPTPLIFDVATIPRDSSIRHSRKAIAQLLQELDLDAGALASAIDAGNHRRLWYLKLAERLTVPGHLLENLARACLFRDMYTDLADSEFPAVSSDNRSLLLAGSAPPDDAIHLLCESLGWNITGELHQRTLIRHGEVVSDYSSDALLALATHINRNSFGPRSFIDRETQILQAVDITSAQAVIIWLIEEDESLAWHVARQRRALEAAGVPVLVMTRRCWDGSDGLNSDVSNFLRSL